MLTCQIKRKVAQQHFNCTCPKCIIHWEHMTPSRDGNSVVNARIITTCLWIVLCIATRKFRNRRGAQSNQGWRTIIRISLKVTPQPSGIRCNRKAIRWLCKITFARSDIKNRARVGGSASCGMIVWRFGIQGTCAYPYSATRSGFKPIKCSMDRSRLSSVW